MPEQETSLARWSHWLDIIAKLAVVGGIIFLGIEIRQNSLMMRAQTRNEIAQTVLGFLDSEREPGVREALQRHWQDGVVGDEFHLGNFYRRQSHARRGSGPPGQRSVG